MSSSSDLIASQQVLAVLDRYGRPISPATLRNYTSRPASAPSGWPAPVTRVGRTPLWSQAQVVAYADPTGDARADVDPVALARRSYGRLIDAATGQRDEDLQASMPVVREIVAATLPDLAERIGEIRSAGQLLIGWAVPVATHQGWPGGTLDVTAAFDDDADGADGEPVWNHWTLPLRLTLSGDPGIGTVRTTLASLPLWLRAMLDLAAAVGPERR